ncbi:MAG: biosynthetic peptidoglycan transglycosylase, partial [Sulfuricella sp.]
MVQWAKVGLISLSIMVLLLLFAGAVLLVGSPAGKDWVIPFRLTRTTTLYLKATPLLGAATSPWGQRLLAGSRWRTRAGTVTLAERDGALVARCAPCEVRIAQLSADPLRLSAMTLALHRDGNRISGWLAAANGGAEQRLVFSGSLDERALALNWELPRSEIAEVLGLLRSALPEAGRATVLGHFSATGTLSLPSGKWSISPHLEGFEVYGLGTERLRYGTIDFVCRDANGMPQLRHGGDRAPGWVAPDQMGRALPRAVLAAEDSRFYEHPGYDLEELVPLLADAERNGQRGASTLTQQLAKNLYTGADRNGARKLRELLYAVEMERTLGKRRILTL